ncbi:hypothetical protein ACFVH6_25835 [Spirillospora sp. NPDC127200]
MDPFADDPFADDSIPTDPWSQPAPTATPATKENPIPTHAEDKLVLTLKRGSGYDSPWIVLHTTVETAKDELRELLAQEIPQAVSKVAEIFAGTAPASAPSAPRQSAPPAPSTPPGVEGKSCAHGPMVFRNGTNKFGKPYQAWFCPQPKDAYDKCKPIFS